MVRLLLKIPHSWVISSLRKQTSTDPHRHQLPNFLKVLCGLLVDKKLNPSVKFESYSNYCKICLIRLCQIVGWPTVLWFHLRPVTHFAILVWYCKESHECLDGYIIRPRKGQSVKVHFRHLTLCPHSPLWKKWQTLKRAWDWRRLLQSSDVQTWTPAAVVADKWP